MKKVFPVLLIIALFLSISSCGQQTVSSATPSSASAPAASSAAPPAASSAAPSAATSASPSPTISDAEKFLAGEPPIGALGTYIKQHAGEIKPKDGDMLLERLLLLQLDVSMDINLKLWSNPYMKALNDTMGGVLVPDKIQNITDPAVRGDFQMLADSYMTVVRYEETPAAETDWAALLKLKDAFSQRAGSMIELESHQRGSYYGSSAKGLDLMASDIAAIEKELAKPNSGFVRWQLNSLYSRLVATLLFGPEGQYLSDFSSGNKDVQGRLSNYLKLYGDTKFGRLCMTLLNMQSADQQAVSEAIMAATVFGPDDDRYLEIIDLTENGVSLSFPAVRGEKDTTLAGQLNSSLRSAAEGLLLPEVTDQRIYCHSTVSGIYLSVTLSSSFTRVGGQTGFDEKNLNFNLKTGKTVTLDELTGKPFKEYKDTLRKEMHGEKVPPDIKAPVDFSFNGDGLSISVAQAAGGFPDLYNVTLNGLRGFMDISQLY